MTTQTTDPFETDRDPLEVLASDFAERCRRGERPSCEEYARRHPELADDVRALLPAVLAVELAKQAPPTEVPEQSFRAPAFDRLGDFRIIRQLGRGGMGIVYEAEQESLGRRVAIKVLPREFLADPTRQERFERESRTAAKLHHTNIVPIFGTGEHDGHPYFVMQYIRGVGMDAVFRALTCGDSAVASHARRQQSLPRLAQELINSDAGGMSAGTAVVADVAYWRQLAGLFSQAADALDHAHGQGVLHRDVKPGNLLLGPEGILWVADFGLAKALEHDGLTEDGDVIGTLRYMAPEQFRSQADARSDVYSLGVTLYEFATLKPALADGTRSRMIRTIVQGSLTPPRQVCPALPLDLETIILKATAHDPQHRYASAAGLRDDLRRFVQDLPVLARRESSWEKLCRWSRRNPALATTTLLSFALLLAITIVASAAYFHVNRANARTTAALDGATRQRQRAETTAVLAVEALDTMLDELAPQGGGAPHELSVDGSDELTLAVVIPQVLAPETTELLGHMLDFYRRLAEQDDGSPQLQAKVADAHCRVGKVCELLGQHAESRSAYKSAIQTYQRLGQALGGAVWVQVALARARNELGGLLAGEDRGPQAQAQFEAAARLLEPIAERTGAGEAARFELARAYYLMARPIAAGLPLQAEPPGPHGGVPPGAVPVQPGLRPPRLDPRRPAAGPPAPPPLELMPRFARLRMLHRQLIAAIDTLKELSDRSPDNAVFRHLLALCLRELPRLQPPVAQPAGEEYIDRAVGILEELCAQAPSVAQYRLDLAETLALRPRGPGATAPLERAATIIEALVDERPHVPGYRFALGHVYLRLSHVHERQRRPNEALQAVRQALALQMRLHHDFPEVSSYALAMALYESVLAGMLHECRELEQSRDVLESATRRLEEIGAIDDIRPHVRRLALRCYDQMARLCDDLGEQDKARLARAKGQAFARPPFPPSPWGLPPMEAP